MATPAERREAHLNRYPPPRIDAAREAELAQAYQSFRTDLCLRDLSDHKRRRIWNWIRARDPQTLAFVQSEAYRTARETFGASLVLPRATIERALAEMPA